MPGVVLSGTVVQRAVELPLMDAQAHGLAEQRLIFNREPGIDSIIELVPLLVDGTDEQEARLLAELCREVTEHNVEQLRTERMVTGWASELAGDLHALGLAGYGVRGFGQQAIATRTRGPLGVLAGFPRDVVFEIVDSVRLVDEVLAAVPRAQVLSASLANLLGARKYGLLVELADRRRTVS